MCVVRGGSCCINHSVNNVVIEPITAFLLGPEASGDELDGVRRGWTRIEHAMYSGLGSTERAKLVKDSIFLFFCFLLQKSINRPYGGLKGIGVPAENQLQNSRNRLLIYLLSRSGALFSREVHLLLNGRKTVK